MRRPSIGQRILVGRRYFLGKLNVVANRDLLQTADSSDMVRSGPPYRSSPRSQFNNHQSRGVSQPPVLVQAANGDCHVLSGVHLDLSELLQ